MFTNTQKDGSGTSYWLLSNSDGVVKVARGGKEFTALTSAARTATINSSDLINDIGRGVIITLDVTAIADTPSITLVVQYKDPASGKYIDLFTAAAAVTATGTYTYLLLPGAAAASEGVTETKEYPLPTTWRVRMVHADADSITYSVGGAYII